MGAQPQGARRVAIGAALAAVVSTVLVGVGIGTSSADEAPAAAPPAQVVPVAPATARPAPERAPREEPAAAPATEAAAPEEAPEEAAPTTEAQAPATSSPAPLAVPVRAAAAQFVPGTPCTATARACVDLDGRTAWLIEDGAIRTGPVSVMIGDEIDPTPRGTFTVEWKAEQWTSREYLTQMPYAVFFAEGGIAFHEGAQDTNSAGCVKLTRENAVTWFRFLQVGDEVQIR